MEIVAILAPVYMLCLVQWLVVTELDRWMDRHHGRQCRRVYAAHTGDATTFTPL